jgi:hypothetical protein
LVTAVVFAMAVVGYLLVDLKRVRIDLSADQASVLSEDMRNKLHLLDAAGTPTVVTAFTGQRGKKDSYFKDRALQDLLEEIDHASSSVETHFVDFDRERLTAEKLGVTDYSALVVQRGDQRLDLRDRDLFHRVGKGDARRIDFVGEAAVARLFAQLLSNETRKIYALVGHGEMDPEGTDPNGMSDLRQALDGDGYKFERLDLVRDRELGPAPRIPEDAAAVVVARPTVPIPAVEEDLLLAYLSGGGRVLVSLEPGSPVPSLVGRLGVTVPEGRVLDTMLVFPYPDRPVPRYKGHAITRDLSDQLLVTVVAGVAPVQAASPAVEGVRASTLLETSRDGWIERGGQLDGSRAIYEPEIDGQGPATMAVALEVTRDSGLVKKGSGRVIVIGDADALANSLFSEGPGNASFAVNCIRWLAGDEARLSVVGKPAKARRLAITEEDQATIRWVAIGMGPMLVIILGAATWAARRGR